MFQMENYLHFNIQLNLKKKELVIIALAVLIKITIPCEIIAVWVKIKCQNIPN